MTLDQIEKEIKATEKLTEDASQNIVPLSDMQVKLAGYQSFLIGQLEIMKPENTREWLKVREKCTSDRQADKEFERTEDGLRKSLLYSLIKRIDILNKNIASRMRIKKMEVENIL